MVHGITVDGSILAKKITRFKIPSEKQKAMAKSKKNVQRKKLTRAKLQLVIAKEVSCYFY
jgi:hypothetical protein